MEQIPTTLDTTPRETYVAPEPGVPAVESGIVAEGVRPSTYQNWSLRYMEALKETPYGSPIAGIPGTFTRALGDWELTRQNESFGVQKISAEEATKRFGMKFDAPVDPMVAAQRAERYHYSQQIQSFLSRGENSTARDLAIGFYTFGTDPINLLSGYAAGGAAAGLGLKGITAGASITAGRIGVTFGENLVGNIIPELVSYPQMKKEDPNYTVDQAFANVVVGSLGGTVIHGALSRFARAKKILNSFPEAKEKTMAAAKALHENGYKTSVKNFVDKFFKSIPKTSDATLETTYHPSSEEFYTSLDSNGKYVSHMDDLDADHGHATSSHVEANEFGEKIVPIEVSKDAVVIDMNSEITTGKALELVQKLKEFLPEKLPEGMLVRDILDTVEAKTGTTSKFIKAAKEIGADVIVNNFENSKRITVLNNAKINKSTANAPVLVNKEMRAKVTPTEETSAIKEEMREENHTDYEDSVEKEIVEKGEEYKSPTRETMKQEITDIDAQSKTVEQEIGEFIKRTREESPENSAVADWLEEETKQINREYATIVQENDLIKRMADCLSKGIL